MKNLTTGKLTQSSVTQYPSLYMPNSPEPAKGVKRRAQGYQNASSVQKSESLAKSTERVRRFKVSFLEREFTQILTKNYIANLLFLTILSFAVNEDRSILPSRKNGIYILEIDPQLLFHKGDIVDIRLSKN